MLFYSKKLVTALVPLLLNLTAAPAAAADQPAGTVTNIAGAAVARRAGTDQRLAINAPIFAGDHIVTSENGGVKLLMADDSVLDLGPKTSFKVDKFTASGPGDRNAVFSVLYGRLRALVTKAITPQSKIEVRTNDAVMGVRGTEFVVNAPQAGAGRSQRTDVTVVSGTVGLSMPRLNSGTIALTAGTQATAHSGMSTMPAPVKLEASQAASLAQSAKVADNTFERTVSVDKGVQNEAAPSAASPTLIASQTAALASASASVEKVDAPVVQALGTFGVLDQMTDTPAVLIPAIFQRVTVRLGR